MCDGNIDELLARLRSFDEGSEDFPGSYIRTVTLRNPDGPEAAATIQSLEAEKAALEELAAALVAKLDECDPHLASAFAFMDSHGMQYSGPRYGQALDALRAALKKEM